MSITRPVIPDYDELGLHGRPARGDIIPALIIGLAAIAVVLSIVFALYAAAQTDPPPTAPTPAQTLPGGPE